MGAVAIFFILLLVLIVGSNLASEDAKVRREAELNDEKERKRLDEYARRDEQRRLEAERREEMRRLERADERALELGYKGLEIELTRTRGDLASRDRELVEMRSRLANLEKKDVPADPRDIGETLFEDDNVVAGISEEIEH